MQCHRNLILPIVVPVVSYLVLKSFSSGLWDQSSASSGTTQQNGGVSLQKMKEEDQDKLEMKTWSSRQNLRINDPKYNPFIMKHELKKSLLCDCGNCIKSRMKQGLSSPMINLD